MLIYKTTTKTSSRSIELHSRAITSVLTPNRNLETILSSRPLAYPNSSHYHQSLFFYRLLLHLHTLMRFHFLLQHFTHPA